ncbi:MAG TPA: hypothetical protein VGK21_01845, partial [Candidatus Angelobacter sp.]
SRRELRRLRISEAALHKHFGGLRGALENAGLRPSGSGFRQQESALLLDWARVARKLKKNPSVVEYEIRGSFSAMPFERRYGSWTKVPDAFVRFARKEKIQGKWKDVLKLIAAGPKVSQENRGRERQPSGAGIELRKPVTRRGRVLDGLPIYGAPMHLPEMAHEPLNELGVIFAFGVLARRLGFVALRFQPGFPDCEALREVARGVWQRVRIEFEFESRNFLRHRHKPNGCELIVCWKHNWKECPKGLEVIELRKVLHRMIGTSGEPGN